MFAGQPPMNTDVIGDLCFLLCFRIKSLYTRTFKCSERKTWQYLIILFQSTRCKMIFMQIANTHFVQFDFKLQDMFVTFIVYVNVQWYHLSWRVTWWRNHHIDWHIIKRQWRKSQEFQTLLLFCWTLWKCILFLLIHRMIH